MTERCFICDKKLSGRWHQVYCDDDQAPAVGPDCFHKVVDTGVEGLPTNLNGREGPRVWAYKEWTPSRLAST